MSDEAVHHWIYEDHGGEFFRSPETGRRKGSWSEYEEKFLDLMAKRRIEELDRDALDGGCLLCSEDKPHHCHRRLVAEYLRDKWGGVEIVHL